MAVSGCFCLCGGTFAGTNSTCRNDVAADRRLRKRQVSAVDGVEAAAEKSDIHSGIACDLTSDVAATFPAYCPASFVV